MALFEKGNSLYKLRITDGKPKKYSVEEWTKVLIEYFEFMESQYWLKSEAIKSGELAGTTMQVETRTPLTRKNLCVFAGISEDTLANYLSNEGTYVDYFGITSYALTIIDSNLLDGALIGAYNNNLVARMQNIKEQTDITTDGKEVNQIQIFQIPDNNRD